jgi:predicted dehydrogenase
MSARDQPTRIGVVGCGTIAYWTHLRALRRVRDATLVGAADTDPNARARAARLTGVPVHPDAESLAARADVDAIVVCPATFAHADAAIAACAQRKPFYLEKPIATSRDEAERIAAAASDAGVIAVMGFNRRHHPIHERARALLATGAVGRVHGALSAHCEPVEADQMPAWKRTRASGGGALLDLGSHHLDLIPWLLQDPFVEVEARIASLASEDDGAWLRLATRAGVVVQSAFSFRSGPTDWLVFLGSDGTLLIDRFRCALELRRARRFGYGQRRVWLAPRAAEASWRLRRLVRPSHEPSYERALGAFVREVRGGPAACARLSDGARALEVALAAEESARAGRAIPIAGESGARPPRD